MRTTGNPRTIKKLSFGHDPDLEEVQRKINQAIDQVNTTVRQLARDTRQDIRRGQAIHELRITAVSALNSDEGVLQFRLSGTKHYLLARLSTVLCGAKFSTTLD